MLTVDKTLSTYKLAAGEPFLFDVQLVDENDTVLSLDGRAYVLTIYNDGRKVVDAIDGEHEADASGPFLRFARDGSFSELLSVKVGLRIELAERYHNGRNVVAAGGLTIAVSAATVASFDNAPIGYLATRARARIISTGTTASVLADVSLIPFVASPVTPSITLKALSLSTTSLTSGEAAAIDILGTTDGSALFGAVPDGMMLNSAARSITGTPTTIGDYALSLRETLAGTTNSPRTTILGLRVEAPPPAPTPTPAPNPTPAPTPTPASSSTPQTGEEAIFSPPNTAVRSSFALTKQGVLTAAPQSMIDRGGGGNGPYWPTQPIAMPSAAYPDRHFIYYSTDHDHVVDGVFGSGTGGIYVLVAATDPHIASNWKVYAAALAAGWLNDFASKPSAEPIWVGPFPDGSKVQVETPQVNYVSEAGLWVMTYQVQGSAKYADGSSYINQASLFATSPDGLNWSGDNVVCDPAYREDIGSGHVGYLNWGRNPFPALINPATGNPWKYVGYSSLGDGGASPEQQLGSDNPAAKPYPWTRIGKISPWGGRAGPDYPGSATNSTRLVTRWLDVGSFRRTSQGLAGIMIGGPRSAGAGIVARSAYEVLMDDTGLEMLGRPQRILTRGSSGEPDASSVDNLYMSKFGDQIIIAYQGQGGGNKIMLATSPKRNPLNTVFAPLDPPIPADYVTQAINLKGASAIPAGFTPITGGTALPAAPRFDAKGMIVDLTDDQEFYLYDDAGFVPADTTYAEFFVEDWQGLSQGTRYPYFGFASARAIRSGLVNALFVSNKEGANTDAAVEGIAADGTVTIGSFWGDYEGIGYGSSGLVTEIKDLGIRWFPSAGDLSNSRVFGLGLGRSEVIMQNNALAGLDLTQRFYRFFGWKALPGTAVSERIGRITMRTKTTSGGVTPPPPTGDADVSTFAISPSTVTKPEGNSGSTAYPFTVTRTGGTAFAAEIDWTATPTGSNPASPDDFVGGAFPSGTLSFAANTATATITVNVAGETSNESDEQFKVTLSNGRTFGTITTATAIGTITNDDAAAPPPPTGTAFVYDTMTGPDGSDVADVHTAETGGIWTKHNTASAPGKIAAGRFAGANSQPRLVSPAVPPSADYSVEADFTVISLASGYPGILARVRPTSNVWYGAYYSVAASEWRLMLRSGSQATSFVKVAATLTVGQTYHVKLAVQGSTLAMYVDDMTTPIGTKVDGSIAEAGQVGIMHDVNTSATTGIHIDNIRAASLS